MSSTTTPTVFVCGATGSQGGALARQLRQIGWNVHATTRNPGSAAAQALKDIGVVLTQADWDDTEALEASMAGCDKLFLCLMPNFADMTVEPRQARQVCAIAKAAGVKHVVASTTLGVAQLEAGKDIPPGTFAEKHVMNKKAVESAATDAGFDHVTCIRPGFFMANFIEPKVARYPEIKQRTFTTAMLPETKLPLIDHQDIASLALAAFQDPARYNGRAIGIASENKTMQETMDDIAEAIGAPGSMKAIFLSEDEIAQQKASSNVLIATPAIMRNAYNYVDLAELATMIKPTTFKEFLRREAEAVTATFS